MLLIPSARRVQLHVTNDSGGTVMMRIDGDGRSMLTKAARQLLVLVGMRTSAQVGHDHRFGHTLVFDAAQINELASGPAVIGSVKARVHFHEVSDTTPAAAETRARLNIRDALSSAHKVMMTRSPTSGALHTAA